MWKPWLNKAQFKKDPSDSAGIDSDKKIENLEGLLNTNKKIADSEKKRTKELNLLTGAWEGLGKSVGLTAEQIENFGDWNFGIGKSMSESADMAVKFDQSLRDFGTSAGLLEPQLYAIEESFYGARFAAAQYGMEMTDLIKIQSNFSEATGRMEIFSEKDFMRVIAIKEGLNLSEDSMGKLMDLAGDFERIGLNMQDTYELTNDMLENAMMMGVNAKNVFKAVTNNAAKARSYRFLNGMKDMVKMAAQSEKFRINMEETFAVAEKNRSLDNVLEMTGKLGALGMNIDPFNFLFKARNDAAGLQSDIIDMTRDMVSLNETTGEFEILPADRDVLKDTAEAIGMDFQKMLDAAFRTEKLDLIERVLPSDREIPENLRNLLADTAKVGRGGKLSFQVEGFDDPLSLDKILGDKNIQQKLQDQADAKAEAISKSEVDIMIEQRNISQGIKETVQGIFGQVKQLPVGLFGRVSAGAGRLSNRMTALAMEGTDKDLEGGTFSQTIKGLNDGLSGVANQFIEGNMSFNAAVDKFTGAFKDVNYQKFINNLTNNASDIGGYALGTNTMPPTVSAPTTPIISSPQTQTSNNQWFNFDEVIKSNKEVAQNTAKLLEKETNPNVNVNVVNKIDSTDVASVIEEKRTILRQGGTENEN